jgi:hypothetical protein
VIAALLAACPRGRTGSLFVAFFGIATIQLSNTRCRRSGFRSDHIDGQRHVLVVAISIDGHKRRKRFKRSA